MKRRDLEERETDKPYQQVLDSFIRENKKELSHQDINYLKSMVHAQIEIEYAASISRISAQKVGSHVEESGVAVFADADSYIPVDGGGFDKILTSYMQSFRHKFRFHCKVFRIEYDIAGQSEQQLLTKVSYTDKKGAQRSKWAKTVLVTVPLGVLKRNVIQFQPPLPQIKLNAIANVGYGTLNKCIMYWETPQDEWWPKGKEVLTLANGDNTFTTMFNDMEIGNGNHSVLGAWIAGEMATLMESKSDDFILEKVHDNLKVMMNRTDLPRPSQFVTTRWGVDEYSYGSYSWKSVGPSGQWLDTEAARRELGARTGSNLFWAGEASHAKWSGTTVGAYSTGQMVVDDILLALQHENYGNDN